MNFHIAGLLGLRQILSPQLEKMARLMRFVHAHNIDARKAAEKALRDQKERLPDTFKNLQVLGPGNGILNIAKCLLMSAGAR